MVSLRLFFPIQVFWLAIVSSSAQDLTPPNTAGLSDYAC